MSAKSLAIWSKGWRMSSSTGVVKPEPKGDSSVSVESLRWMKLSPFTVTRSMNNTGTQHRDLRLELLTAPEKTTSSPILKSSASIIRQPDGLAAALWRKFEKNGPSRPSKARKKSLRGNTLFVRKHSIIEVAEQLFRGILEVVGGTRRARTRGMCSTGRFRNDVKPRPKSWQSEL